MYQQLPTCDICLSVSDGLRLHNSPAMTELQRRGQICGRQGPGRGQEGDGCGYGKGNGPILLVMDGPCVCCGGGCTDLHGGLDGTLYSKNGA